LNNNVLLTQGVDAVCIFVNDIADAEVLRIMASNGVNTPGGTGNFPVEG